MKVGIIGQGFVGSAIRNGLENFYEVLTYDINEKLGKNSHEEVCVYSDIIFVCVPTPMFESGECDLSIVESVVSEICLQEERKENQVIVIKSTVVPGTVERLADSYPKIDFVFKPEFLIKLRHVL